MSSERWTQSCPYQLVDGQIMAQCRFSKTFSSFVQRRRNCRSSRRGAWRNGLNCCPTNVRRLACQRGTGIRNVVGRSENDVRIADEGGMNVDWVPVRSDKLSIENAIGIRRDGGAEQLARMLPRMPDKQAANLIATGSMVQRTAYVERVIDPKLSLPA